MSDLYELLTTQPVLLITFAALGAVGVLLMVALLIIAFVQGREISIWLFRLGPRTKPANRATFIDGVLAVGGGEALEQLLVSGDGQYKWAWAGENWSGYLTFVRNRMDDIVVDIDLKKLKKSIETLETGEREVFIEGPTVMKTTRSGAGKVYIEGNMVRIREAIVKQTLFAPGSFDAAVGEETVSLEIDLVPTLGFRGDVWYELEKGARKRGGIAIVKDKW
jgi:hypothetical protein